MDVLKLLHIVSVSYITLKEYVVDEGRRVPGIINSPVWSDCFWMAIKAFSHRCTKINEVLASVVFAQVPVLSWIMQLLHSWGFQSCCVGGFWFPGGRQWAGKCAATSGRAALWSVALRRSLSGKRVCVFLCEEMKASRETLIAYFLFSFGLDLSRCCVRFVSWLVSVRSVWMLLMFVFPLYFSLKSS